MIVHLVKHSFRSFKRQGGYVAINILGLSIGLACSLLIAMFIVHELSYDRYHEHKDRIYRVGLHGIFSGTEVRAAYTSAPMGPAMVNDIPEVESFLRMHDRGEIVVQVDDRHLVEPHFIEADSTFFDFFSIPLVKGNQQTALTEPFSVVLSETSAMRLFGDGEDPVGQTLRIGNTPNPFKVTGIMEDVPETTHFHAGMIASFSSNPRSEETMWLNNSFFTYVKLHPEASLEGMDRHFEDMILTYVGPQVQQILGINVEDFIAQGNTYNFFLQPLTGIHLDPTVEHHQKPSNDPRYLWIFGTIGVLILVIASINFMNLSTAQATKRAREVGMKKVIGSTRGLLIRQFVFETVVLALASLLIAVMIAELSLPFFNDLLSLQLSMSYFARWYVIPFMLLLALAVGVFAGSYPAFYLSAFSPAAVLKGKTGNSKENIGLRRALTVMQFVISIMLISGSMVMYRQLNFMLNKELGFDRENILVLRQADTIGTQIQSFKSELERITGVASVSASTAVPGRASSNNGYIIRGREEESFLMHTFRVDYDFLETFGIQLADGRFFDPDMPTDRQAVIVNERSVRNYALGDPFATRIVAPVDPETPMPVIGVVRDFHFESLRNDIAPAVFLFKNENVNWGYISIRIEPGMTRRVVEQTEQLWASFTNNSPMLYFFLDEDFNRFYGEEQQNARLSVVFTVLAIIIASLGLYGLTAFALQQRLREISIRKTFGARVSDIWYLVCRDVMLLVGVATIIAWPLVYWVAGNWLQNYPFRISMQVSDFVFGFMIAAMIALATISYKVIRTASLNPAVTLRSE